MGSSPPKLGGVAAPSKRCREATLEGADGVVLLGTTPARLMKRRRATPPNLGGELPVGGFATFVDIVSMSDLCSEFLTKDTRESLE
jgi:hypothetical protein